MLQRHAKLRGAMVENGYTSAHICRWLNRGAAYVSLRMSGHESWRLDECYEILRRLHIPEDRVFEMFPPITSGNVSKYFKVDRRQAQ